MTDASMPGTTERTARGDARGQDHASVRCPVCGYEQRQWMERARRERTGPASAVGDGDEVFHCEATHCGVRLKLAPNGAPAVDALRLTSHFSLCVLAFSFPEAPGRDPWKRLGDGSRWRRRTFSLTDPEDVDRTEYFLPYIRRFLFPTLFEANAGRRAANEPPTCEHFEFPLDRLGPTDGTGLPLVVTCDDVRKEMRFDYRVSLERAELIVFSYRCAFLVLKFRHPSGDATLFDQMNAIRFLRHIAPQHRGFLLPTLSAGGRTFSIPQLLAHLLQEFGDGSTPSPHPADVPATPVLPVTPIYDDRMMIYSFSCLDRDTCLGNVDLNRSQIARAAPIPIEPDLAARGADLSDESLESWRRIRWAGHSKDGGVLIVFNTDTFHEEFLGVYHESYYFDVFLLAALQRVTLITLFDRLSDINNLTTGSRASHRLLRKVRYDLLRFTNQCCFSQITNRERGQELSRKWQAVFENPTLMLEVHEQSDQLDTYLRNRTSQQVETLVRVGGFVATAVPAVLGMNVLFGDAPWVDNTKWGLLIALVTGTGLLTWIKLYRQSRDV